MALSSRMTFRTIRVSIVVVALLSAILLSGCEYGTVNVLEREHLFELTIGRLENELDLITRNGVLPNLRTSIAMRDGFVYVGNGPANKVMEFTSYGDLIRLVYDPEDNPVPVSLGAGEGRAEGATSRTRTASEYGFGQVGSIAVDSRRYMYVEDRLPPERAVFDDDLGVHLNRIIVRFDETGTALDYIGQEGIGGTPFPFVESISVTVRDELAVVAKTMNGHFFYLFSPGGDLMYSVRIGLDRLPVLEAGSDVIAVLEEVAPGTDGYRVYLKISYYQAVRDQATDKEYGINMVESRVYWIDLLTGRYDGYFELPDTTENNNRLHYQLLGIARDEYVYLAARIDVGRMRLLIMNDEGRVLRRRNIAIPENDLVLRSFHVAPDGVLTGLLGYTERADVVWWRADRLLPESGSGNGGADES